MLLNTKFKSKTALLEAISILLLFFNYKFIYFLLISYISLDHAWVQFDILIMNSSVYLESG